MVAPRFLCRHHLFNCARHLSKHTKRYAKKRELWSRDRYFLPGALKRARILAKSFDFFGSISRYFCISWSIFFASPALGQTAETILGDTGIGNNLSFTRSGNRLTGLSDTGSPGGTFTFAYDALGNLASDGRKGLVFSYNVCNLLREVTSSASGSLTYTYLSDGTNTALQFRNRDYYGGTLSAVGVLPYLGDLAKVGRIGRTVREKGDKRP